MTCSPRNVEEAGKLVPEAMQTSPNAIDRPAIEVPPEAHAAPQPERLKVLLIEDNRGDARLIELMLADKGSDLFELESAERLGDGLRRLQEGA
jgi:hypothetical protein